MRTRPLHDRLYDVAALTARVGVGIVFLAHGWQKIQVGIIATSRSFAQMDVPAPTAAAIYATFTELLGGLALIAGLGLPIAGVLLFADMAGALVFVHAGNGLFLVDQGTGTARGGFELVLALGAASLLFAAGGGGRISLDHRLFSRRRAAPGPVDAPQPPPPEPEPAPPPRDEPQPPETRGKRPPAKGRSKKQPDAPDAEPAPGGEPAARPRPASEIIEGTGPDDVFVAGRRKPRDDPGA
ncbi:DoxX family protein [uncultured Thermomonospora sp.]|uniref:DoxX family protein n=1 Tax=uncultured Thermomonospora sp. TaxID=671175 RepID=UPI00259BA0E8|nr:DoxX family protein [uncultured Thermomonospora sp.]